MFKNPISLVSTDVSLADGERNIGGILDMIRLIPITQMSWDDGLINGGIIPSNLLIIEANINIANIVLAPDSGIFLETMSITESGSYWLQEILFDIPKNKPSLSSWIMQNFEVDFFVMLCTKNRESMILGGIEQPLRFLEESGSPSNRAAQNKRTWKLSGMVSHPAYFISANYTDIN
jgi:hypothetical protein